MITVMGATGRTGRRITETLLAAGEPVRALGRSPQRLAPLAAAGAVPLAGDAGDPAFLTAAFRGADAVYTLLPFDPAAPDHHGAQGRIGEAVVTAVREAGAPHVVALSSVGADRPTGTGLIASLHAQEQRLRALPDAAVLLLRPGSYFENVVEALPVVEAIGVHADAVAPEARVPMVSVRDVADAAAAALLARDWSATVVRELLGPHDMTWPEVTAILGERLGRPDLPYVQLPSDEMVAALVGAGWSTDCARLHVEMCRAFGDGTVAPLAGRSPATATPTGFEDVVDDLVAGYVRAPVR